MTLDREDYDAMIARNRSTLGVMTQRPVLENMAQAEVKATLLTGAPHWDTFLSYIQAAVEHAEESWRGFERKLGDPNLVDYNEIMKVKISLVETMATITAWKAVASLPSDLIRDGNKARDLLSRMNDGG